MIIARGQAQDQPKLVIEEITDPVKLEQFRRVHEQAARNYDWLKVHWKDLLPAAHGKFVAVAGQEAFVSDTHAVAWSQARAAHPDDEGAISQYVMPPGGPRIYASSW